MKYGPLLFLGAFAALSASFAGLVLRPQIQLGSLPVTEVVNGDGMYPSARPGQAAQGREVYRANGCFYCHTQQVQPKTRSFSGEEYVADLERGWGERQTTARDFIYDRPVMLGNQRIGPDLANYGARNLEELPPMILRHLYNPQMDQGPEETPSTMPSYPFLFEKHKLKDGHQPHTHGALDLKGQFAIPGYEVVPTEAANALVAYLLSLNSDVSIMEAPLPAPPAAPASTNAVAGATNTVAGSVTNAPAGGATNAAPATMKKPPGKGKKGAKKNTKAGAKKTAPKDATQTPGKDDAKDGKKP